MIDSRSRRELSESRLPSPSISMLFSTQHFLQHIYQGIRFHLRQMAQASFYRPDKPLKNSATNSEAGQISPATPMRHA
jgi:hypothetical protein